MLQYIKLGFVFIVSFVSNFDIQHRPDESDLHRHILCPFNIVME